MKIIEANEGPKISHTVTGNWLNIGDQIMLNLEAMESEKPEHRDIYADAFGKLYTGELHTGERLFYVAQIDIPARGFTEEEIDNPEYDAENKEGDFGTDGKSPVIIRKEPIPFSIDNVTLTLYALKEGVF